MATVVLPIPGACTDPSLPKLAVVRPAIPGAVLDFSASSTPAGSIAGTSVPNHVSGALPLVITSGGTTVAMDEGGRRFWRFTGSAGNVSSQANSRPQTRVMRVRMREDAGSGKVILGNSIAGGQLMSANSDRFYIHAGTQLNGPAVAPDMGWHIVFGVFDGATSVVDVDGATTSGSSGANTVSGFRVAASGAGVFASIDVSDVALLPFAASAAQRAEIRALLA